MGNTAIDRLFLAIVVRNHEPALLRGFMVLAAAVADDSTERSPPGVAARALAARLRRTLDGLPLGFNKQVVWHLPMPDGTRVEVMARMGVQPATQALRSWLAATVADGAGRWLAGESVRPKAPMATPPLSPEHERAVADLVAAVLAGVDEILRPG